MEMVYLWMFIISFILIVSAIVPHPLIHGMDHAIHSATHGLTGLLDHIHVIHIPHHIGHVPTADVEVPQLNGRTLLVFTAFFGGVGYLLSYIGLPEPIPFGLACGAGYVMMWIAWQILLFFAKQTGYKRVRPDDPLGHEAEVMTNIRPGNVGRISVNVEGRTLALLAKGADGQTILRGASVIVMSQQDHIYTVYPNPLKQIAN